MTAQFYRKRRIRKNGWMRSSLGWGAPVATDELNPDYYRTAILLDATGQTDGNSYATDSSRHNHTINYNGGASVVSEHFEFDGIDDFIDFPNSLLWTPGSKFTMEVLGLSLDSIGGNQGVASHYSADVNAIGWAITVENDGTLKIIFSSTGGGTTDSITIGVLTVGPEYNISVSWDGNNIYCHLNGELTATYPFSGSFFHAATTLRFGALADNGAENNFLNGRFKCFLFTRGESIHTNTSPNLPRSTNVPTLTDPLWPDVAYLIAYDEDLARIRDFGPLDLPIQLVGLTGNANGTLDGSDSTVELDGSGDYILIPHDPLISGDIGDHCFDAVGQFDGFATINTIHTKRTGAGGQAGDVIFSANTSSNLRCLTYNSSGTLLHNVSGSTTLSPATKYHFGLSLDGTTARVLLDGEVDGSGVNAGIIATNPSAPVRIARDNFDTTRDWDGRFAWFRRTNAARYTGSYTVPDGTLPVG